MTIRDRNSAAALLEKGAADIPEMNDVLALYRDLMPVVSRDLMPASDPRALTDDEVKMRLSEGFTLTDPGELMPDNEIFAARVAEVNRVLVDHSEPGGKPEADLFADGDALAALAAAYLTDGEEALRRQVEAMPDVNPERAMFVVFNALKGVFMEMARRSAEVDSGEWEAAGCPVCGGMPAVAYLEGEGGQRYLICHRCESTWRFMRIMCPYCGNREHQEQGYFTIEGGNDAMRVDFCKRCNSYIKTWDVRDREDEIPEIEDLLTPGYDLAAEQEGFSRGAPNIFGVWIGFDEEEPGEEGGR